MQHGLLGYHATPAYFFFRVELCAMRFGRNCSLSIEELKD